MLCASWPLYRISSWGPPVFGCFYPDTRQHRCLLFPPHPYGAPLLLCLQPCFSPFEGGRRLPSEHLRKGRTPRLALAYPRSGAPLSREASAHTLAPMLRAPHPVLLRSGYYPPKRFGRAPRVRRTTPGATGTAPTAGLLSNSRTKGRTDTQCAMRYEPRMPFSISRMRLPAPEGNRSSPPRPGGGSIARASDAGGPAWMRNGAKLSGGGKRAAGGSATCCHVLSLASSS